MMLKLIFFPSSFAEMKPNESRSAKKNCESNWEGFSPKYNLKMYLMPGNKANPI